MSNWRIHIIFLILAGLYLNMQSQLEVVLEKDSISLGEQIQFQVALTYRIDQENLDLTFPQFGDTITQAIEIVKLNPADTSLADPEGDPLVFQITQSMLLTSFEEGFHPIPPISALVNGEVFQTDAKLLSVYAPAVELEAGARDIKEIKAIEVSFWDYLKAYWHWVIIVLAVLISSVFVIKKLLKRKAVPTPIVEEKKVVIDPYDQAIKRLAALKSESMWQNGMVKEYYSRLTNIIREYIENRYDIPALEETTHQIMSDLKRAPIDQNVIRGLRQTLELADLVKFAKAFPQGADNENSFLRCEQFVHTTQPEKQFVEE